MSVLEGKGWMAPSNADYVIDYDATTHLVWQTIYGEMRFRPDLSDANLDTAIESCIADTTDFIVIHCTGRVDGDGRVLTITRGRVAIVTGLNRSGNGAFGADSLPRISEVILDTNANEMKGIFIQGFHIHELNLYARNTNLMENIKISECEFTPTASYDGIVFTGDYHILNVDFVGCYIRDQRDQSVDNEGAITFRNTSEGTGQIRFERLGYRASGDDRTLCAWVSGAWTGPTVWFTDLNVEAVSRDNQKIFHVNGGGKCANLHVKDAYFEVTGICTIFTIDNAANTLFRGNYNHNHATYSSVGGENLTLINNTCTAGNFMSFIKSRLIGDDNTFAGVAAGAVLVEGTTGRSTAFTFDVGYAYSVAHVDSTHLRKTVPGGGSNDDLLNDGTDEYLPIDCLMAPSLTALEPYGIKTYDVIYRHMSVWLNSAPGVGNTRTFTLYVNGAPTALTVTITGIDTAGTDWTNEEAVAARVPHCWLSDGGVSEPTASQAKISVEMLFQENEGL